MALSLSDAACCSVTLIHRLSTVTLGGWLHTPRHLYLGTALRMDTVLHEIEAAAPP